MEHWRLTYVVDDGTAMFGLEAAPEYILEARFETAGKSEQDLMNEMREAAHRQAGRHVVLTNAVRIAD